MIFDRAVQIDEHCPSKSRWIGLSRERPGDVRDAGGVVRAQALPELLEGSAVCCASVHREMGARTRRS